MSETAPGTGALPVETPPVARLNALRTRLLQWLPQGTALPEDLWRVRHRVILGVVFAHAVALAGFGFYMGWGPAYSIGEGTMIALMALIACWERLGRRFRSGAAALGAVTASAVLVQFSGGYIEAHFHFFIMVALISMYQDWAPFLLAVVYVALDHGVIGTLRPDWVYNHPAAIAEPWKWAGIHAVLVLGQCAALLAFWRATERAQAQALDRQGEVDRLRGQEEFRTHLLTTVSHELKTPLTPLQLQVRLLKKGRLGVLTEPQERSVSILDRNLTRLSALVDQTLEVGRLQAGRLEIKRAQMDLTTTVKEVVEAFHDSAQERGVRLELKADGPVALEADHNRVVQVVYNLLNNALKFTPTGGTVTATVTADETSGWLHVTDTGIGIRPDDIARLGQPFSQVHDMMEQTEQGSGLGLYISRQIIERHGGALLVASEGPGRARRSRSRCRARPPSWRLHHPLRHCCASLRSKSTSSGFGIKQERFSGRSCGPSTSCGNAEMSIPHALGATARTAWRSSSPFMPGIL